jgi:hypothetical protein
MVMSTGKSDQSFKLDLRFNVAVCVSDYNVLRVEM